MARHIDPQRLTMLIVGDLESAPIWLPRSRRPVSRLTHSDSIGES